MLQRKPLYTFRHLRYKTFSLYLLFSRAFIFLSADYVPRQNYSCLGDAVLIHIVMLAINECVSYCIHDCINL